MSLGFYPHKGLDISCLQHFLSRIWFHRLDCNQGLKRSRWPTRQGFGEQIVQLRVSLFLIFVFVIQHSWHQKEQNKSVELGNQEGFRNTWSSLSLIPTATATCTTPKAPAPICGGEIWGWSKYLNSKIGFHLPTKEKSLPRKLKCSVVR